MGRGMITLIDTVTQVFIKFQKKKKANQNMGINIKHNTNNTYKNGDKCVRRWKRRKRREMRMPRPRIAEFWFVHEPRNLEIELYRLALSIGLFFVVVGTGSGAGFVYFVFCL